MNEGKSGGGSRRSEKGRAPKGTRRTVLSAAAVTVVLALVSPGSAHLLSHPDPNDARQLDIRTAEIARSDTELSLKMTTYDRLRLSDLYYDSFLVRVDSRGDDRYDFVVRMGTYESTYPYCTVYDRDGFDRGGREAEKGRRSLRCSFESGVFEATKHIRWKVASGSTDNVYDRAPDSGWFRH